jgi:hypothetical protein
MPPQRGSLVKLKIMAYSDDTFSTRASVTPNPLNVMINPSSYSRSVAVAYTTEEAAGADGKSVAFNRDLGETLSFDLVFDGTDTVPDAPDKSVHQQIEDLRRLCYVVNGKVHTPNYLKLGWGTLLFKGVLKSLSVDYGLFAPDGEPLRAKAKASFLGFQNNEEARAFLNETSPDLTHAIVVEAGQTLPMLCHEVYRDSRYYLLVAAHNGLDDFRALEPGTLLLFPPLAGTAP